MNNNRGNNRRRGRGNNNRQGGGGQPINRIDSRARGNAPQLLEKYRKLAHDAHLNGDRVTEEYYLQFADHYFRVIADTRQRQDEQRARRDDRWQENGEGERFDGEDGEYEGEGQPYGETPSFTRREREPREPREREDRPRRESREEREPRAAEEAPPEHRVEASADAGEPRDEQAAAFEPADNPFTREGRARGLRPRRNERRPRRDDADGNVAGDGEAPAGLDPSSLPPAIGAAPQAEVEPEAEEAKPKRRTRKPRAAAGDSDGTLEAVG